ncbi:MULTISPECIES: hypothetical protein [Haloferax]|uniref:Uncharacterized protein n=1 Tax=Haloferax sulfurifontis TaxID=255616 RepID=A0A830ED49_9EURY|nr:MULTISPECIES: hypothetical protein [Haloferax]GGC71431.1 hypothetical protein GCM10007209_36740 [Haloferax sulfurifontis]
MSSSASNNPPEDSPWTPDEASSGSDFSEGKREITDGFRKLGDGASEVVHGLIVVLLILLVRLWDDDEEERAKESIERKEEWDNLSASVQRKFDESNVTEDDVDDAIEWARSQ